MLFTRIFRGSFLLIMLSGLIFLQGTISYAADEVYRGRRERLMQQTSNDGIIILKNSPTRLRSNDVDYPYRPDSDFYYLSGCDIPDALMLLVPRGKYKYTLFVKPANEQQALWITGLYTTTEAQVFFHADTVIDIGELEKSLSAYLRGKSAVFLDFADPELMDQVQGGWQRIWRGRPQSFKNIRPLIHQMRTVKDDHEIALLKQAVGTTGKALNRVISSVQPGMFEYQLAATLDYVYQNDGCRYKGFPSIIASGPNATILHYDENKRKITDGDLVLMDVGAEFGNYSADITRTIPANGKFTDLQKNLYQLVLDAQTAAIGQMQPGNTFNSVYEAAEKVIKQGLFERGLIIDVGSEWQHLACYYPYISHGLGLDVHDPGEYGGHGSADSLLQPGMVMTIEPGLYFSKDRLKLFISKIPERFQVNEDAVEEFLEQIRPMYQTYMDTGIRIEDDVLITESGNEVLSKGAVKAVDEIEKLMHKR